jgi:glycosyltransferase involved in cell wall biosynthesis
MANEFVKRGYAIWAVTNDSEDVKLFYELDKRVHFIKLDARQIKIPWYVKTVREINKTLKLTENPAGLYRAKLITRKLVSRLSIKPDIIVTYEHEAVLVANRLNMEVPKIAMVHNSIPETLGLMNKYQLAEENKMTMHQVLMPSYVEKAKKFLSHRIVYIPNTVEQVQLGQRAELHRHKTEYTIISVGRIDWYQKKNHLLLEAFALLAQSYPNWNIKLYGIAFHQDYLQKLKKIIQDNHLEKQVFLCGATDNVTEKLLAADIYAIPSSYEGFSLSLSEAMAVGLPSVGFDYADSVNEMIVDGENGVLCPKGVESYAEGLEKLMCNQKIRIAMGNRAAEMMQDYSPKHVWDMWDTLFKSLIHTMKG